MRDLGLIDGRARAGLAAAAVVGAALLGPQPGRADDSTTRPSSPAPAASASADDPQPRHGWLPGRGDGFRHWGSRPGGPPMSDADRDAALQFMSQHAPVYYKAIAALPDEDRQRTENAVARAYVLYQRIGNDDPDLYGVMTKRIEVEDRIYDLGGQARAAPTDAALRSTLRDQVAQLCELNLKERELRLARLERAVRHEKDLLAADSASREKLIDTRLGRVLAGPDDGPLHGGTDRRQGDR